MKDTIITILISSLFILNVNAKTLSVDATFVRCVDGDTAIFDVDGEEQRYRFLAIDTPESVKPNTEVQAFGKDASEYTCTKLTNSKKIVLEIESSAKEDKYGRKLAWVWVDGKLLQEELVSVGYAKVAYVYGNYKYAKALCLYQQEAYERSYGIWEDEKKQGYCYNQDLSTVEDNIKYSNIGVNENSESSFDDVVPFLTIGVIIAAIINIIRSKIHTKK